MSRVFIVILTKSLVDINAEDQLKRYTFFPNIIRLSSSPREIKCSQRIRISVQFVFVKVSTFKSGSCEPMFLHKFPGDLQC
jgi:hypothetical protein